MISFFRSVQSLKKHTFAIILVALIALGFVSGILAWSRRPGARQQAVELNVTSKTNAVRVLKSERTMAGPIEMVVVRLQNISGKEIHAYSISNGKNSWVTRNYFLTEESFTPGAVIDHLIPISDDDAELLKSFAKSHNEFSVEAVIFSDGNVDVEDRFGTMLANERAGIRDQIDRILPSFRNLSLSNSKRDELLADLKTKIERLPEAADASKSPDYQLGLRNAKTELMKQLSMIEGEIETNKYEEASARHQKLIRTLRKLESPASTNR